MLTGSTTPPHHSDITLFSTQAPSIPIDRTGISHMFDGMVDSFGSTMTMLLRQDAYQALKNIIYGTPYQTDRYDYLDVGNKVREYTNHTGDRLAQMRIQQRQAKEGKAKLVEQMKRWHQQTQARR